MLRLLPILLSLLLAVACTHTSQSSTSHQAVAPSISNKLSAEEMFKLGAAYRDGTNGVQKDIHEAIKWFELAAHEGNIAATMSLGVIYGGGNLGVPQDLDKAIHYYQRIAQIENKSNWYWQSSSFLARAYEEAGDTENAILWHQKVVDIYPAGVPPRDFSIKAIQNLKKPE